METDLIETADNINKGFDFGGLSGTTYKLTDADVCWYPFAGRRDYYGALIQVGESGAYASWTRDLVIDGSNQFTNYYFSIGNNDRMLTSSKQSKAEARSVRCVRE